MTVPECVAIPGGSYTIGCSPNDKFGNSHELPRRELTISAFSLGRTPVTEGQFAQFQGQADLNSLLPVVGVSWDDAVAYCAWLISETGEPYRLPTEAEWEYACRAGTTTAFPTGEWPSQDAINYLYDEQGNRIGPGKRLDVGWGQPNAFGLHDMMGNVAEWVADDWVPDYTQLDPAGAAQVADGSAKVIRGGSWDYLPRLLRSSSRDYAPPSTRRDNLGFRIAKDL